MSCTMSTKPYVLSCDTHSCHFCPWPSGRAESDFIKNLELFKVQCRRKGYICLIFTGDNVCIEQLALKGRFCEKNIIRRHRDSNPRPPDLVKVLNTATFPDRFNTKHRSVILSICFLKVFTCFGKNARMRSNKNPKEP